MPRVLNICASILVLLGLHCNRFQSEKEPTNNTAAGAQEIIAGKPFQGSYYSAKGIDKDHFKIITETPIMISGQLSGVRGADPLIRLFQSNSPVPFKTINDAQSSSGESFGPLLIEPPYGIIEITLTKPIHDQEYIDSFHYEFEIATQLPPNPVEREPNDDFEQAAEINEVITGFYSNVYSANENGISSEVEKDLFIVRLPESRKYRINADLSGITGIDPVLRVFDNNKNVLRTIDERAVGQGEKLAAYGITGPTIIYLGITAKDFRINSKDYYELRVGFSEHESKYEFEPNDNISTASKLLETRTYGEIAEKFDQDFYLIESTEDYPEQISVIVHPDESLNVILEVFDAQKKTISVYDDSGKGQKEGISNLILQPASRMYLKVSAKDFNSPDALAYEVELTRENVVELTEREPNNSVKTSNEIWASATMLGFINPNTDIDYYRLKLEKSGKFQIEIDGLEGCSLGLKIADKKGAVFERRESKKSGESISASSQLEPGSILQVYCVSAEENLFRNQYKLLVKPAGQEKENEI
ncbi:MAG: hypothetical protein KDK38_07305 [Leptospiraceae bacterium]|nr:hypothetical protein [Leptospiraceae bacterium]